MKNSMTTTAATTSVTAVTASVTATDKYLTFREGSKVICKIAKGDAYYSKYDLPTNITEVNKPHNNVNGEIKIDVSNPDFVIHGDLHDLMMDFQFENRNVKIVDSSCEIYSGIDYIGNEICSVYCGN